MEELKYGLLGDKLVHINDVERGLACNCLCPHCKGQLIAKKGGKSYFHFYNGLISDAIIFEKYPCVPKAVRLMNTGKMLEINETALPEFFNDFTGRAEKVFLHLRGVPVDELGYEPITVEIEW